MVASSEPGGPGVPDRGGGAPREVGRWCGATVGRGWGFALGLLILILPLWLWADPLDGFSARGEGWVGLLGRLGRVVAPFEGAKLIGDDFSYVADSRTTADLARELWTTHNAHVVPLFRAWTWLWVRGGSGTLAGVAGRLALASYLTYVAAVVLIGRLVGRETGQPALGLAAMAVFGISAVLEATVRWYSAGQAIAAGVGILAMLVGLQGWRLRGGWWRLAGALGAAGLAPLVWTVGYIAGPVGLAYLWADGRHRVRRWAILPVVASAVVAAAVFGFKGRQVTAAQNFHGRDLAEAADPVQGMISSAQGVIEILVLRIFGLAAATTPTQAVVLLILLALAWAGTRGRPLRLNPLEAAGGVIVGLGFGLVYTARGYYSFANLRDLHWYQAVPAIGGVLFAAGWWAGRGSGAPPERRGMTRGELAGVVGVVAMTLMVQAPRVRAHLAGSVPAMTASERTRFLIPTLTRMRARHLGAEEVAWQRRLLTRLDEAEAWARARGWTRAAIRAAIGGAAGPTIPLGSSDVPGFDPVALLALPATGPSDAAAAGSIRSALLPLLTPGPQPRPPWLAPAERWPPGSGGEREPGESEPQR